MVSILASRPRLKSPLGSFFKKILNIAELIDSSALHRVRVDSAKNSIIVDRRTHPVLASGKQHSKKN